MKTKTIYRFFPSKYEKLKQFSDYQGNTLKAIEKITPIESKVIVDLGTGTGNIALSLSENAKFIYGFDAVKSMVRWAIRKRKSREIRNCRFSVAEHRNIPIDDATVDVVTIGWALVGFVADGLLDDSWKESIDEVLRESERVLKGNGYILILETVNIANELPRGEIYHPTRKLFLTYLEQEHGFKVEYYDNDWQFENLRNVRWSRFWFGDKVVERLLAEKMTILEECVGIWWKSIPGDAV